MNIRPILLSLSMLFFIPTNAMESPKFAPMQEMPSEQAFFAKEKNQDVKKIHNYNVDPLLQRMNSNQLEQFKKIAGFLAAKRLADD